MTEVSVGIKPNAFDRLDLLSPWEPCLCNQFAGLCVQFQRHPGSWQDSGARSLSSFPAGQSTYGVSGSFTDFAGGEGPGKTPRSVLVKTNRRSVLEGTRRGSRLARDQSANELSLYPLAFWVIRRRTCLSFKIGRNFCGPTGDMQGLLTYYFQLRMGLSGSCASEKSIVN